jgi:hypothetical protein
METSLLLLLVISLDEKPSKKANKLTCSEAKDKEDC